MDQNKRRVVPGTAGYGENAASLAPRYESIAFADVHREVAHLLPPPGAGWRIVDIGAGAGRDAAALALAGHRVTAVEPTSELRHFGQQRHASAAIEWIDDALPELTVLQSGREKSFDLVLLTAVWMHLDLDERRRAMPNVAALLKPGGLLLMMVRRGPVPAGRRMFDVSDEATSLLAADASLAPVHATRRGDVFGRGEVSWSCLAFRR